jgi:hypothetical protein
MEIIVKLARVSCCVCGCQFALPETQLEHLKNRGRPFHCPNGHELHFGESRVDQLKREIGALQRRLAEAHQEIVNQKNIVKLKDQKFQRTRRRVNAGVCPHCRRTFRALARHIATKHPTEPLPNEKDYPKQSRREST